MNKKILSICLVLVLLAVPFVSAFRDVECGHGNSFCQENELDDEFDDIESDYQDADDDLQDQIDDNVVVDDGQQDEIDENSDDIVALEDENLDQWVYIYRNGRIDRLQWKAIKKLMRENDAQWRKIRRNKMDIWVLGDEMDDLRSYISLNEARYLAQDGNGVSFDSVLRYLMGEYLGFLKTIFVQKDSYQDLESHVYELRAKVYFLENDMDYTSDGLEYYVAYFRALDSGDSQFRAGEYVCDTRTQQCIGIN